MRKRTHIWIIKEKYHGERYWRNVVDYYSDPIRLHWFYKRKDAMEWYGTFPAENLDFKFVKITIKHAKRLARMYEGLLDIQVQM